ncbi:STY4528 family pathogenicity island replication protein [Pseudomonas citronellolis]|uniref:STY4528 family pathogenicity island replication protein n=1 Tax=Pseudomonas citronellolis TaxID=53408 RepID=UPI0021C1F9A7|nr:STY4528 family pathogenicity island replication protein [Pseudomonas citronellolis]UXJ50102.1 STY4528 family pathogenicity island replication protein [Pseudomonas citronellolis]
MASSSSHPTGSTPLTALLDDALRHLAPSQSPRSVGDSFLYSGNRQESVPRALLLDRRLTPLERNAWQVFRLLLNDDGVTAFPTYDQLRQYLASTPCAERASHETVARALTLLRLTRWLSLVRRRRDAKSGRLLGNLYVLHDEPLTPYEAMQLDPEYLGLVSHSLDHASKAIQQVGYYAIRELAEDPLLQGRILPTRLQVLVQRMAQSSDSVQGHIQHESEEPSERPLRNGGAFYSDSEVGGKPSETAPLRNPKQDRTEVLNTRIKSSVRTAPHTPTRQELQLPEAFLTLKDEQQAGALVALQQVEPEQRQAVLDEWAARCCGSEVRKPAGYLFGIIQKAIRGEFKSWAGQGKSASEHDENAAASSQQQNCSDVAQTHLAQLHALLGRKA